MTIRLIFLIVCGVALFVGLAWIIAGSLSAPRETLDEAINRYGKDRHQRRYVVQGTRGNTITSGDPAEYDARAYRSIVDVEYPGGVPRMTRFVRSSWPIALAILACAILSLALYGIFGARDGRRSGDASHPALTPSKAQAVAQTTPQATATVPPPATPTPDATGTAIGRVLAVKAEEARIAAQDAANRARQLDNVEREGQLLALYDWTPTAQARLTERALATAQEQADRDRDRAAQVQARELAEIAKATNAEITRQNTAFATRLAVLVVAGGLLLVGVRAWDYRSRVAVWHAAASQAMAAPLDNIGHSPETAATLIDQSVDGGQSWRRIPPPPAHIDDNPDWVSAALAGESVAIDVWERAGAYNGNYRELYRWLARSGLLKWTDRAILNADGIRAVAPHSPTADMSPDTASQTSVPCTDWQYSPPVGEWGSQ